MRPDKTPVLTFALGESELSTVSRQDMVGNYAAWTYFQSIDRAENKDFVRAFKARFGASRTVSSVMESSYNSTISDASLRLGSRSISRFNHGIRNNCRRWWPSWQTSLRPQPHRVVGHGVVVQQRASLGERSDRGGND